MSGLESWREEKQSAWLYRSLAEVVPDPAQAGLFRQLGEAAERQAETWAAQQPGDLPAFRPSPSARLAVVAVRRFGLRGSRTLLAALKIRGLSASKRIGPEHGGLSPAEDVGRHHRGYRAGGNLRAAVFGANDGLVSNASLLFGVAGAASDPRTVLLAGVAGLLAGAFSMAAGEYVSVRSQRELLEYQLGLERAELAEYPEEEALELALIYQARGLPAEEALSLARRIVANPESALQTLAREELGLDPDELGNPWGAAIASFSSFAAGAVLPLLPFLLIRGPAALPVSVGVTALALFAIGATLSLFVGRGFVRGGLRLLLIGGGAGLATYALGRALGVGLG